MRVGEAAGETRKREVDLGRSKKKEINSIFNQQQVSEIEKCT